MNSTNQTGFGFGSTAPSFGSASNTQSSAGTLFGGSATNNLTTTGGLFGSTANNNSAGTLFGTNTNSNSTAGTLFGGSATTTTPASTGFGGFGSTPATSSTFGTNTSTATGFGTTTGGFGATSQPAASIGTGFSGFGNTAATNTSGFGTSTTTNANNSFGGFGSMANTNKPSFGGFGATNNLFGNKLQTQQNNMFGQQQMGAAPVQEKVWQELALIRARFDPTSPLCQFRHYFYNLVPANEIHLYVRPQNQDEQLWNEAVRKNPDPANLVPVLAIGFDDILKRMEIQSKQLELHQEKLKEATERLSTVQRQYLLGTLVKLEEHKRRHTYLTQRLLRLLRYSQVLRYKGFPLTADEEQSMNKLSQMISQIDNPEQLNAKLVTLWNQLQAIKAQKSGEQDRKTEIWRTVNEEDTNIIAKVLEDEQKGIKHVTSILKSDTKELEDIETRLKEKRKVKSDSNYISRRQT
ncbi:nucleoporin complex subunit 54-domain-containing protein [Cokeromyces recurvatus]|uniref:nucleoporin complex subunit 54-domain-containing protein n=1 Tax=Cokeromyces recurvatus TaxID=90255 RepID=UPI00221E733F|nr:nucleoporin complex subunit 54-domain-containing protein [Cokeromyces recurvatus]KAI7908043.1 nucleoporin complex subunit 54-domain-containing protein [Cokeromyces recurvatus]